MFLHVKSKGSFNNTKRFLKTSRRSKILKILNRYGNLGVESLSKATPKKTGLTASSWYYEIVEKGDSYSIFWGNTNIQNGIRIAVILDLGHATSNGGYVEGKNYIKPAIRPIFDDIARDSWKEVRDA